MRRNAQQSLPIRGDNAFSQVGSDRTAAAARSAGTSIGAAAAPAGGGPAGAGVTAGPNRQEPGSGASGESSGTPEAGGVDWLEVSVYGQWHRETWESFRQQLDDLKTASQEKEQAAFYDAPGVGRVLVWSQGANRGKGRAGRGIACRWVLEVDGFKFFVVDRQRYDEDRPSVFVEIGSLTCMTLGGREAWERARRTLDLLGLDVARAVPSRVDVCVDLAGVGVEEFVKKFLARECIKRAVKSCAYLNGWEHEGLTIGRQILCRIYDKLGELTGGDGESARKLDYLLQNRWNGDGTMPACATRVEFQIRRKPLRDQFSIESMDQLWERVASLGEWLTSEWLRFTKEEPDRENNNTQRAETAELWERVASSFAAWMGEVLEDVRKRRPGRPMADRLFKQALGCLASAAAVLGRTIESRQQFFEFVESRLGRFAKEVVELIGEKRAVVEAGLPAPRGAPRGDGIPF
jgi:hypothetical protein